MAVNTIGSVWDSFLTHMKELEGTGGPPVITVVTEGEVTFDQELPPFVVIQLIDSEPEQRKGDDKIWQCRVKIRVVELFSSGGITATIANRAAEVEDKVEAFTRPTGVAGFEDAKWSYTYPNDPTYGNLIVAESLRNFTVAVARGAN